MSDPEARSNTPGGQPDDQYSLPSFGDEYFAQSAGTFSDLLETMREDQEMRRAFREAAQPLIDAEDEFAVGVILYRLDLARHVLSYALKHSDLNGSGIRARLVACLKELEEEIYRKKS